MWLACELSQARAAGVVFSAAAMAVRVGSLSEDTTGATTVRIHSCIGRQCSHLRLMVILPVQ